MKPLSLIFRKSGVGYTQVARNNNVAIYRLVKGDATNYEVIVIVDEQYPIDMSWGQMGWTCVTLDEARDRMKTELYFQATE